MGKLKVDLEPLSFRALKNPVGFFSVNESRNLSIYLRLNNYEKSARRNRHNIDSYLLGNNARGYSGRQSGSQKPNPHSIQKPEL